MKMPGPDHRARHDHGGVEEAEARNEAAHQARRSTTARAASRMAASVCGLAAASALAMAMRKKGWRATTQGRSSGVPSAPLHRVEERVVGVGVAVRPAVHGEGEEVARGIEAEGAEHAAELVADLPLEGLERRRRAAPRGRRGAGPCFGKPGATGRAHHLHHGRLVRGAGGAIVAERSRARVEEHARVVAPGRGDVGDPSLRERRSSRAGATFVYTMGAFTA